MTGEIFRVDDLNCIILQIVVEFAFSLVAHFWALEAIGIKLQNLNNTK